MKKIRFQTQKQLIMLPATCCWSEQNFKSPLTNSNIMKMIEILSWNYNSQLITTCYKVNFEKMLQKQQQVIILKMHSLEILICAAVQQNNKKLRVWTIKKMLRNYISSITAITKCWKFIYFCSSLFFVYTTVCHTFTFQLRLQRSAVIIVIIIIIAVTLVVAVTTNASTHTDTHAVIYINLQHATWLSFLIIKSKNARECCHPTGAL